MTRRKLWIYRGLAVLISTACGLALIELIPRAGGVKSTAIVRRLPSRANPVQENNLTVFDPELIFRYQPNLRFFDPKSGGDNLLALQQLYGMPAFRSRIDADAEGFLNPQLPKPINEITNCDVVILGDSFMACPRLYDTTPFETSLKRHLPNGDSWLVLNYGMNGFGPQQQLQVLKKYALPKQPRFVVWAFFEGNDLLDAISFEQRLESAKKQSMTSVVATVVRSVMEKSDEEEIVRDLSKWYGVMPDGSKVWFAPYSTDFDPTYEPGWPLFTSCLTEAKQLCDEKGVKFLLLCIPSKFHVYREFMTIPADSQCRHGQPNDITARVRDLCGALKIDFRDCVEQLKQPVANGTDTFYRNDSHWNETGSSIGAKVAADWLAAHEKNAER